MKLALLCVLVVVLAGNTAGELPPPQASYKILMLLPVSSRSHRNVFLPLAKALAERGHKIVMLTNEQKPIKHPNIYEFEHGLKDFSDKNSNMFNVLNDPIGNFRGIKEVLCTIAGKLYDVPKVQELYNRRKDFDVILIDHFFNELAYPFVHEMPFITVATAGMDLRQSAVLGNVLQPSQASNLLFDYPTPITVWQRFVNILTHIGIAVYWRNWAVVPELQKKISARFPDLPPLLDIERNQSLALLNSHFSISRTVPLLPSQVEVGAMHCRPATPLPQDLESWISGAGPEGVIYFSLGSVAKGNSMPVKYRQAFIEAFHRLPHRVIWKYEEDLESLPENVMISKWLPQQDILAHDSVKVFITHGGQLSIQESIYHATPLLALPIFGDQLMNAYFVENSGYGDMLLWKELTVEAIVDVVTEITTNPKYKENVLAASRQLRDQLTTPQERAVFWTEYVIRHRGAPQLRSPAAQLSWVEFLMLDVLFFFHVGVFISIRIWLPVMRGISTLMLGKGSHKVKTQ